MRTEHIVILVVLLVVLAGIAKKWNMVTGTTGSTGTFVPIVDSVTATSSDSVSEPTVAFGTTANIASVPTECESLADSTINIGKVCYDKIWKTAGCTTDATYVDWHESQTKAKLVQDSNTWANTLDNSHRQKCYGTSCSTFDKAAYLKLHPDVAAAKVDGWVHYKTYGYGENRSIVLSNGVSGKFDRTMYLKMYPSIGMDPWTHYSTIGYNAQQNICVV